MKHKKTSQHKTQAVNNSDDSLYNIEKGALLDKIFTQLSRHLTRFTQLKPIQKENLLNIDICNDYCSLSNFCGTQLENLFPTLYDGKTTDVLHKISSIQKNFVHRPDMISNQDTLFLLNMSIFLDKIDELKSL